MIDNFSVYIDSSSVEPRTKAEEKLLKKASVGEKIVNLFNNKTFCFL